MSPDCRVLRCYACMSIQIRQVLNELIWKCKFCHCFQRLSDACFRGTFAECQFYVEHVIEKKSHTCEIIYDGERPSTSKGIVKGLFFKAKEYQEVNMEDVENPKENRRENRDEDEDGSDNHEIFRRRIIKKCKLQTRNSNLDV